MGAYKAAVVTEGGQNLIAQALADNKTLTFVSAKTSSYIYPAGTNITALTGLQDIVQSVPVNKSQVLNNNTAQVSVRFDNDGVTQQYQINTIGVYAQIEDGPEILFAVIQAITPDEMPVQSSVSPSAFIYNIQFNVQNASQITIMVTPAGVATFQDILDVRQEILDIEIPEFEDYTSEEAEVPEARTAVANIKSKTGLKAIISNIKAALMGMVTLGEIRALLVNHGLCTEPGKFFLDAAYGKYLTDQITQLNSDMGIKYEIIATSQKVVSDTFEDKAVTINNLNNYRFLFISGYAPGKMTDGKPYICNAFFVPVSIFKNIRTAKLISDYDDTKIDVYCMYNNDTSINLYVSKNSIAFTAIVYGVK
ncbi:MAG TPA: hypothetical protein DDY31_17690 [Lachnospiraceae bacterium]|nr:hypothetical protein [Lachnospiraceae bacterium]